MPTNEEIKAGALALVNSARQQHGMPPITWTSRGFIPADRATWKLRAEAVLKAAETVRNAMTRKR